ncbi:MAG: hypothetical protein WCG47_04230 [Dermatophilaceae bacterium]
MRIDEGTIIDLFAGERDGSNVDHFCLVVTDVDVDELAASYRFTVLDVRRPFRRTVGVRSVTSCRAMPFRVNEHVFEFQYVCADVSKRATPDLVQALRC